MVLDGGSLQRVPVPLGLRVCHLRFSFLFAEIEVRCLMTSNLTKP